MPDVIFRAATSEDIERLLEFWRVAAYEVDHPPDTPAALVALLEHDPGALVLAVDGEQVVGSVVVGWDGWRGHIYRLAVHSGYRRTGLGTRLLDAAETLARNQGCRRIDAIVFDQNQPAARLWSRGGYQRQEGWSRWVKQLGP